MTNKHSIKILLPFLIILSGCNANSSSTPPNDEDTGTDPSAPFTYQKYQSVLRLSSLQVSDPHGNPGNIEKVVINGQFSDYYSDYFYYDQATENLTFNMTGDSNRSELVIDESFDTSEIGTQRILNASILPVNINASLANASSNNSVTYLQIHNQGIDESGNGAIPHPLVRVVYEQERDGLLGHYWAVIKTNALDCNGEHLSSYQCDTAYERVNLGEANLDNPTAFKLTVRESTLLIEVDNKLIVERDINYWSHLLSHFKAGVHNQFEDGTATVHYPSLSVTQSTYEKDHTWDINQWKITIPASKNDWYGSGGTTAAELEPAHCRSSKDILDNSADLWFSNANISFFNVDDNRMHFRTNMGYGTTTANSNYIRSELRELFNAQTVNTCSTSRSNTSWFINDTATGTTKHTLRSALRIEEYPTINGQDSKVIVGQVHGWEIKQALVKILWEGEHKPVRVILNKDFYKNNQSCSSGTPSYPACQNWSYSVDMGTYSANVDWQYYIEVDNNGILLETMYDDGSNKHNHLIPWGEAYPDRNGNLVTLTEKWTDSDVAYYFKAGIYPQFKPDSDLFDKNFDVSFKHIELSHR
ncbi:polysaccharide lyase family 7 protein [Vibrio sp. FNV 38]|nr:polysaccharide lyase family 7 protein [Vibrio sp. FNV 38]